MRYWRAAEWLAAGPSGSAHVAGQRWKNVPRLTDWMEGVAASGGYSPIEDYEGPDAQRALAERLMLGLRLAEGVAIAAALGEAEQFGRESALEREGERQIARGMLMVDGSRWRLTERGFLFADGVAGAMMGALDASA